MTLEQALDFSFRPPDPVAVTGVGIFRLLGYTGSARPSIDYLASCGGLGIQFVFVQETYSERALEGWNAGILDAQFADRRADEVGYPRSLPICYVVSDGNASNPNTGWPQIADYAAGVAAQSARPLFFYGNRYAVDAALSGAPGARGGWLPVTWGFDPDRDLMAQESNTAPPIEGTDLNTVYRDYTTGGNATPSEEDDMPYLMESPGGVTKHIGGLTYPIGAEERDQLLAAGWKSYPVTEDQQQQSLQATKIATTPPESEAGAVDLAPVQWGIDQAQAALGTASQALTEAEAALPG